MLKIWRVKIGLQKRVILPVQISPSTRTAFPTLNFYSGWMHPTLTVTGILPTNHLEGKLINGGINPVVSGMLEMGMDQT